MVCKGFPENQIGCLFHKEGLCIVMCVMQVISQSHRALIKIKGIHQCRATDLGGSVLNTPRWSAHLHEPRRIVLFSCQIHSFELEANVEQNERSLP